MCVMNGIIDTLALTILAFPVMRSRLLREYKNGTYAVSSFYIAMMFTMACFSFIFVSVMSVPVYLLVSWSEGEGGGGIYSIFLLLRHRWDSANRPRSLLLFFAKIDDDGDEIECYEIRWGFSWRLRGSSSSSPRGVRFPSLPPTFACARTD